VCSTLNPSLILIQNLLGRALNRQWADEQIARFTQTFTMLKTSLNTGVVVQIAFIAHRIYEDVQSIGLYEFAFSELPALINI
jgi:hypothetical protein